MNCTKSQKNLNSYEFTLEIYLHGWAYVCQGQLYNLNLPEITLMKKMIFIKG